MPAGGSGNPGTSSGLRTIWPPGGPPRPAAPRPGWPAPGESAKTTGGNSVRQRAPAGGPPAGLAGRGRIGEQQRRELVQAAAPGQPLVAGAGRLVVDVPDTGLLQRLVVVLDAVVHPPLRRADAEPEEAHALVELA